MPDANGLNHASSQYTRRASHAIRTELPVRIGKAVGDAKLHEDGEVPEGQGGRPKGALNRYPTRVTELALPYAAGAMRALQALWWSRPKI
jgi:hypothetical protein